MNNKRLTIIVILDILITGIIVQQLGALSLSAIVVLVVIWWMIFLMALPFGSKPPTEVTPGHADSAPAAAMMKQKLLYTTLISLTLFLIIMLAIHYTNFSFRPE